MNLNLICGLNQTGYGRVGQNIAQALHHAGVTVSLFPIGVTEIDDDKKTLVEELKANASAYDPMASSLRIWHQFDMAEHAGRYLHIGFPFFELDTFNYREQCHLTRLDRIFVASDWARQVVLNNKVHYDVTTIPLGVDREIFHEGLTSDDLEIDFTKFINIGKWEKRKGHDLLLSAFCKAFTPTDKVLLFMLSYNPCLPSSLQAPYNDLWAKKYLISPMRSKIKLVPRLTSQKKVARLMVDADCGVFPSRAEGWNLELLEMMSLGKHVICTFNTAHTEYANKDNAHLIACPEMESAEDGVWFHGQGNWSLLGNDQEEQLIYHLREVHRLKQIGQLSINVAGIQTSKQFSWENTANLLIKELSNEY